MTLAEFLTAFEVVAGQFRLVRGKVRDVWNCCPLQAVAGLGATVSVATLGHELRISDCAADIVRAADCDMSMLKALCLNGSRSIRASLIGAMRRARAKARAAS